MGEVRVRVDEIIGETEDVIRLFKEGGLDLSHIVKTKKEIKVPNWMIYLFHSLFVGLLVLALSIGSGYETISIILSLIALCVAFLNVALVYAKWERMPLLAIAVLAHISAICLAYGIYSIGDILEQAEEVIKHVK